MFKKGVFFLMTGAFLFCAFSSLSGEEVEKGARLLTLAESIEVALENNVEVLIKKEEIKGAAAGIKEAKSFMLPRLDANAGYYNYYDYPSLDYEENYQANVSLTQILYAGGRLINRFRQSELNLEVVGERQNRTRQEVIFKVKKSFYGVLLADEFVRINQETLSLAEEQLRIAGERYRAGEVSNYDVLRAEVETAKVKPDLVKAENSFKITQNQFKFTIGLDLDAPVKLKGEFAYLPAEINLDDAFAAAFAMRPELKEMEVSMEIGELGVEIAKGGSKPAVSLTVGNYWDEKSPFPARNEWDDYRIGVVSVNIPIFDGLEARAKTLEALARLNAVKISQKNLIEKIRLEVEDAFSSLKAALEVVASQIMNVDRAGKGLEIMLVRYKEGKAAQLDLLDAQVTLSRAKVTHAQSIYDYVIAEANLKLAMGEDK